MATLPGGLAASLRRLGATALQIANVRLELLANEFEQEKLRIFDGLLWAAVALMLLATGLVLGLGLLLWLVPAPWRGLVLGLLALACLVAGAVLLQRARQRLASPGGALAASRAELAADQAALQTTAAP